MKTKIAIIICGLIGVLVHLNPVYAQAPASITGDGLLIKITNGTPPLATYGYCLLLPANSGNSYQEIDIYDVLNNSGTYSYAATSSTNGQITLDDTTDGVLAQAALTFTETNQGIYNLATTSPGGLYQNGFFVFAQATAPSSIAGKSFLCTISDGASPFYSSGTFLLKTASSDNGITNSSGETGTYSYSLANRSVGKAVITFSSGSFTAYLGFFDQYSGGYAATATNGSFQIATFQILDLIPPTASITSPTSGQRWSNSVFTVTGTASDDRQVSSAYYQIFGAGWNLATTTNSWTNWSGSVSLSPGTNIVQAYSVDSSGNQSSIVAQTMIYVPSALLMVQTNGLGTINPNYNGQMLAIGSNYTMTATAGSGFTFLNWIISTNWVGNVTSNSATLNFVMQTNLTLQANFTDTTKPILSITNLVAGQRWSNLVFTAKGTATDNWQIASVQYQLNGGSWSNATGTTNWSAPLTLTPGTNTFAAYAADTSGNFSTTNGASFQYVVTNQLQIRTTGLGSLSPNYSNAWLNLGQNYSITSAPAIGFVFTNWQVSTNWTGGATVTGTNLQFMMESNLTLLATFNETSRPTLTITAPTNNQHMTNALAYVTGTNSDNWGVSGVWYRLNSNAWNSVTTTTNNYTNWMQTVTLLSGTNTVNAYAINLGGNYSLTNSVSFVSSNTFALQLLFTNTQPMKTNGLVFNLQLSTGLNGHIQVSTNLTSWATLTNFVGSNSSIIFLDPGATNSSRRFYRAVIP